VANARRTFTAGVWTEPLLASYRRFTEIPRTAVRAQPLRPDPVTAVIHSLRTLA
jgi:hypothetical protein